MKFGLILTFLLMSQLGFGQTLNAKKVKTQMLERVDTLSKKIDETTDALGNEDVARACEKLNEIFKILPDHLMDVATKMSLFDGRVVRMIQESQMHLNYIEDQKDICRKGETGEFLEIKDLAGKLKSIKKALAKQKKNINKLDTKYSNTYEYRRETNRTTIPSRTQNHTEWSYSWSYEY